ncbi:hypothetical protein Lalb_Chr19g0128781 [Lupinus albus]|uniref:Uncharacterized protein n=1 Tax=Lupinus albus TaxID=3870 RepID=A0A6A4P0A9_LUPAL|nr:hypothetical protein Lalb_Chr19g0128781 [Lupinus albus]
MVNLRRGSATPLIFPFPISIPNSSSIPPSLYFSHTAAVAEIEEEAAAAKDGSA